MAVDFADAIERLSAAAADCRKATTEAHQARKDLKAVLAEARGLRTELDKMVDELVNASVDQCISPLIDNMTEMIKEKQDQATDRVIRTFDELTQPLLQAFNDMGIAVAKCRRAIADLNNLPALRGRNELPSLHAAFRENAEVARAGKDPSRGPEAGQERQVVPVVDSDAAVHVPPPR